jgi:hypothetical protein
MRRLGVSLAIVIASSTAFAQEPISERRQRADAAFEQGRKLLNEAGADKEKIAIACEKFDEAIKLDPVAPGTMLNLGLCNEKLEKYKTALYWFRKAQARAAETGLPEYERAAKEHTVALANKVATIRISFTSTPPEGTRVKIDGDEIDPADYLRAEVDPGTHTLVAGAPGHKIYTEDFTVVGKGGKAIMIQLVRGESAVIVDPGAGRRKAAVIMAAGGGVLWATSIGVSFWAKRRYDDYAKDGMPITGQTDGGNFCSPMGCTPEEATKGANHYQNIARWVATPIFIGGALAIGGAIVLYVTAPDKERVDQTVFAPIVAPDQVGFSLTRSF